ncbi:choice-of-anchor G family protein [Microbacterium sp. BDGP8]|uniref:choice-of-anchor G family protein n=1 Tax=Microbacterium sp. BDGP8 TaxID=3035531 RepID=UPI00249E7900|nr:choice-of-anchor G family protein [Microbacterium sp. BDGP8]WHE37093.1 choice-of-anchor G family protein [Microbacterium sp. BDGP8]
MKTRTRSVVAIAAVAVVGVPMTVTATTAAWNTAEWVHGEVGTSTLDCTDGTGFASVASGRFLSGSLLELDLDPLADLEQMVLALDGAGDVTVSPSNAIDLGSAPPESYVYANPFDVTALSAINVDLTGFTVGLPGAALGAVNQYARVTADGSVAGASGLVNDSGAVLVSDTTPPASLPARARVGLSGILPAVTGIADANLEVGAVAASSQVDGCALLRDQLWGETAPASAVVRDYGIAGLGLQLDAPVVQSLVSTTTTAVNTLGGVVGQLTGPGGLIGSSIGAGVDAGLPGILTTTVGGNVSITGLDLLGSVATLLNTPLTDGVVTINLQAGTIDVDLDALLPSLNNAAPNTEIVLNDAVLNPIVDRAGVLLDNWSSQIVAALTAELREATVTVALEAVVTAPGIGILPGLNVLTTDIGFVGPLGALIDGTSPTLTVTAEAAGLSGTIDTLLRALGLGTTVGQLVRDVSGLATPLTTAVANTVSTTITGALTTLGGTLATAVTAVITALGSVVDALPSVVSLMVNVQPDQPNAPPDATFTAASGESTAEYKVAALRLGLADGLGGIAATTFATASAGPVTAP